MYVAAILFSLTRVKCALNAYKSDKTIFFCRLNDTNNIRSIKYFPCLSTQIHWKTF